MNSNTSHVIMTCNAGLVNLGEWVYFEQVGGERWKCILGNGREAKRSPSPPPFLPSFCNPTRKWFYFHCRLMLHYIKELTQDFTGCIVLYLRNRKHVLCFYPVIETRVKVWENKKCCGNTSRRRVLPQLFSSLPNFHECFYNSIETQSTCFLFLLENTATKKRN